MCPIETPEGPNIGLINSLSVYAKINEYAITLTGSKTNNGFTVQNTLLDFRFNGWGDKFAADKDNTITQKAGNSRSLTMWGAMSAKSALSSPRRRASVEAGLSGSGSGASTSSVLAPPLPCNPA